MPYTPTTPTLVLCADLAEYVNTGWNPTAPDGVTWDFFTRTADPDSLAVEKLQGRQVVFMPFEDYAWENGTRSEDKYTHRVACLVAERYEDGPGDPTREWIATRVDFVHEKIVKLLRFTRTGPAPFNPKLMTTGAAVQIADIEKLYFEGRLFYALVTLEFLELVTP